MNEEQKATIRFLKGEVSKHEDEANRKNYHPNVQHDLWKARLALKKYISELRSQGVNV